MPAFDTLSRIISEAGQARQQQPPSGAYNILSQVAGNYFNNQQAKQEMMQKYIYEMKLQQAQTDRAMELEKYKQEAEQKRKQDEFNSFIDLTRGQGQQPVNNIQEGIAPQVRQSLGMGMFNPQSQAMAQQRMPLTQETGFGKIPDYSPEFSYSPSGGTRISYKSNLVAQQKQQDKQVSNETESEFIKTQAQDTLDTIGEVEKGLKYFGMFGAIPTINPMGYDRIKWESYVNKLLSSKMIDLITQMKKASKTGATGFGQLSEKEGQILRQASTALNKRMKPEDAQEILNNMKPLLEKILTNKQSQDDLSQQQSTEVPQYNPNTHKLQQNKRTGEYRVVPLR